MRAVCSTQQRFRLCLCQISALSDMVLTPTAENIQRTKTNRLLKPTLSRDSSVGIVTRYGLNGPAIEFRWGRDFPHPSTTTLGPPASYTTGTGSLPGLKQPRRGGNHPPPSSAEVKEKVLPFGPSWPVLEHYLYLYPEPHSQCDLR